MDLQSSMEDVQQIRRNPPRACRSRPLLTAEQRTQILQADDSSSDEEFSVHDDSDDESSGDEEDDGHGQDTQDGTFSDAEQVAQSTPDN